MAKRARLHHTNTHHEHSVPNSIKAIKATPPGKSVGPPAVGCTFTDQPVCTGVCVLAHRQVTLTMHLV
eukprot:4408945-Amphidinium_carterae.2